tara:strand:+ start:1084 stop:4815 length:3732 start_codon:yes stop_codon:yes gene_type:complete
MSKEMDILKHAIASKTNYTETLQSMQTANTPEEQQQGLKGAPPNTSMTFPNTASSFTTKGMDYNINISKFDNNGSLVQSFANVPPGVDNLPMGNKTGNVIETPAHEGYQSKGFTFEKQFNTNYQESQNYQRIKNSRKGVRQNPDGSHSTHLMADNNKDEAWPTLFQEKDGSWVEGGYEEANRRGEIYKFDSKKELTDFARKGDWKKHQSIGHLSPRDNVMKYLHNSGRDTSYVNNVVKHIATQESKNTPTQRQIIDYKKDGTPIYGVGTGKFQYEQGKDGAANTAINRTVLFFKDKLDIDLTTTRHKGYENIYDFHKGNGTNTDFTKLSANEQDAIYLAEQIYSGEGPRDNFDILVKGRTTPPTSSEIFNYWGEFHKKKFNRSVTYKDEKGADKTKTIKIKWDKLTTEEKKAEKDKWNSRTKDVHMPTDSDKDGSGVPDGIQRVPYKLPVEKKQPDFYNIDIFKHQSQGFSDDGMYYPPPNAPVLPVVEEEKEDIEQISKDNTTKNNNNIPHTYPTYTGNPSEDLKIHDRLQNNASLMWDADNKVVKRRPDIISALDPIDITILQPITAVQDNTYNPSLNLENQLMNESIADENNEEYKRIVEEEKIKEEEKNKRLIKRAEEYETYKNKNLASTIDESVVFKNYSTKNKGQVTKLQEFLLNEGYDLGKWGADGKYGPATKKARDLYLADKNKEIKNKVSTKSYIDSTDNLTRINYTEHLEANGLFDDVLSPNLNLENIELLGEDEISIMQQDSGFDVTSVLEDNLYVPTGSACSSEGCAKGLNEHLRKVLGYEGTMGRYKFRENFGVQEDAWNLGDAISQSGGETQFTVFNGSTPSSLLNNNSSLNSKLKELIYNSPAPSIDNFSVGDVIDLFYEGSDSYKESVSGSSKGNWNTHTGVVSKGPDGNMYITHNVQGVFKSDLLETVLNRQKNKGSKRKGHVMVASIHRPNWDAALDLSGDYKGNKRELYTLKNTPGIDYKLKTRKNPDKGLSVLSSIATEENVRYVAGIQNNYLYTQTTFGFNDSDMELVTNVSLGLAFQESHYGTADDKAIEDNDGSIPSKAYSYYEKGKGKVMGGGSTNNFYAYKKHNPGEFDNTTSMGVTQIKLDNISDAMIKELGMEKSNDALVIPETAAATTLLRTATTYKFLKEMQKEHPELNITSANLPHILALAHNQDIFKDIENMLRGTDSDGTRVKNTNFDWLTTSKGTSYTKNVITGSTYYDIDWKEFSMGANYKYELYAGNK